MTSIGASSSPWYCVPNKVLSCLEDKGFASCAGDNPAGANVAACGFSITWDKDAETVYMLFVIEKSKQADLTPDQAKALGQLIREELK